MSTPTPFSRLFLLAICLSFSSVLSAESQVGPIVSFDNRLLPEVYKHGMVVAGDALAAEAGVDMLRRGGNAIDAAVATGFALAVTHPTAGNLAGGGFMLIDLNKAQHFIDYREMAPRKAHRDMYLKEDGSVDKAKAYLSRQSTGVPGSVAGLIHALENYGTMQLAEVIQPAIELAEKGFKVNYALEGGLIRRGAYAPWVDPEAKRIFFRPDGSPLRQGDVLKQPDLAWTLKQIRKHGSKAFYSGKIAERLVADMEANDGLITMEDLADYRVHERPVVRGRFLDFEVVAAPPPSSGGVHLVQMLNILENADLPAMGHNSAAYIHYLAESMKLVYADRSRYLGDPDFASMPLEQLISKDYGRRLFRGIDPGKARISEQIRPGAQLLPESSDTTHFSVVDQHGNVVSNTYTLNFSYGNGIVAKGTGMLLNNEMGDFSARPGHPNPYGLLGGKANAIEAGKRPLSSMTPTIVYKDDKPWLVTGSLGGSLIITTVMQIVLNSTVFDYNVATATAMPRVHHQWYPDTLRLEQGVSPDTARLLQGMGHTISLGKRTTGRSHSIQIDSAFPGENAYLYGAADGRRPQGAVRGY